MLLSKTKMFPGEFGGNRMQLSLKKFWSDTKGQDLVEYALFTGVVAVAAVGALPPLRTIITTVYAKIITIVDRIN